MGPLNKIANALVNPINFNLYRFLLEFLLENLSNLQLGKRLSQLSPKETNFFLSGNTWNKLSQILRSIRVRASYFPVPLFVVEFSWLINVRWKPQINGDILQMRSWIHAVLFPVLVCNDVIILSGSAESRASRRTWSTSKKLFEEYQWKLRIWKWSWYIEN